MNLKQIQQEYILNHPEAVKTVKSKAQLTFRQIAGIRESAFSISNLFSINEGEQIIRDGFARWPDVIAGELELLKSRLVD
ncbi:hypothetical protein SF1_43090 [Sphingobacterium faecium NBRC 15299]|uniref:hypothetical protein n=1 Tax=Sphingobacterium faecium TaxID=34087 RepID=UPI000D3C7D1E|nr:hypothetical protein [Sphingobacterium faecium]PTX09874.1 hypothetical protein C8N37_106505 [Sphingobacterium faecium]GEM66327.1 hypothetical protein SF1_43090 [Sphingobacterium faecium NBRC 15299]